QGHSKGFRQGHVARLPLGVVNGGWLAHAAGRWNNRGSRIVFQPRAQTQAGISRVGVAFVQEALLLATHCEGQGGQQPDYRCFPAHRLHPAESATRLRSPSATLQVRKPPALADALRVPCFRGSRLPPNYFAFSVGPRKHATPRRSLLPGANLERLSAISADSRVAV